jgi:hypothetical protein
MLFVRRVNLRFGRKADVAADDLERDAMKLFEFGDGGQSDKAVAWSPSLFAYRQGPVSLTAPPR